MAQKSQLILAAELLKIKAVKLQPQEPFTWASGWKSPFYCDNRKTLSFPELRTRVKLGLANLILEEFPEADTVAGVATGAIAQGALVAEELGKPFVYVRPKAKDHGLGNQIESIQLHCTKRKRLSQQHLVKNGNQIIFCENA